MTHMRPDSKGDVPAELAPIFDVATWKRVGVLEEDSFLHSFSYAIDVKYQKLSVDVKETYAASARRKLATAVKKALTSKDPAWAPLIDAHTIENLAAFQTALGKRTYTPLDSRVLSDVLSHVHQINIITWTHDAGFSPLGLERLSDEKFVFLVNARGKHWEPLICDGVGLFDINDDITVRVLKYIRESRMAAINQTDDTAGWKETMVHESDVIFSDDLGYVDIQTIRDIEASDLSMEQVEAQLFDLVSGKQRYLKRTVNGLSRLFYDVVNYKAAPGLDIRGAIPIIEATYKPIEDDDGENIFRHDRAAIRNSNREGYAEQRLRLNDMQRPFVSDTDMNWTPVRDVDAQIMTQGVIRLLAPKREMRGYPYGGDEVSVTGIMSPFQGPYWKLNTNIKSYSMDAYEDAIAELAPQDKLRITFVAPYYDKNDKLVDEIDATVVTTTSSNIQLKLEHAVHRRGDELLTNSLFYQRNAHNDFLLFPELMIRIGANDGETTWSISRGRAHLNDLLNLAVPTIQEWLVMHRSKLAEYDNPLDIEHLLARMGWSVDNLSEKNMSLLRDLLRPVSKAKAHLHREAIPTQGRKLMPIFKANASLIKRLYGSTQSTPDNRFWLHLFKEQIAEFLKSASGKTYRDRLKEIHRVLPEHENRIQAIKETYDLKRAEIVYKKEYASLEELCQDQNKLIPEWEGEYAFSPVEEEKDKKKVIVNCIFRRFNGRWILLGKWKDTDGTISMLPYHESVYPPKWMPVADTESLNQLRDTMQSLRRLTSLRTMESVLSKLDELPALEKALSESAEHPSSETYIPTFYTDQVRIDLDAESLRLQDQDDADTGFVEDYDMQQFSELLPEDAATEKLSINADLDALCKHIDIVLPAEEEKLLVELIPTIMTLIVDSKYKKFTESSKFKAVRGYKQQLHAMLGEEKASAFDKEYSLYIIAAIMSILLIVLPPLQPRLAGLRSFKLPDVLDALAAVLVKEFGFSAAQPHTKIMGDMVDKILFKIRPIYKARFDNAPLKKPVSVDINMKANRFRPPLVPVSDMGTSRSGVSQYLHSLYTKFANVKNNSNKDKATNSCCFDKVHSGMRYSDILADIKIPPASKNDTKETDGSIIQSYLPRTSATNLFKEHTVRVSRESVHKIEVPEKLKAVPITLQTLLKKNPLLVNSEELESITFNDIAERVRDTFVEQWELTQELITRSGEGGLPARAEMSKYIIDLGNSRSDSYYYRLFQGIEHFLDYDIRRIVGRFFWRSKWSQTTAKWVELILAFSLNRISGANITDTLYLYQYVVVRTMFLLMWSFTVPSTADFRARLSSSSLSDCSEAIREFVVAASLDDVEALATFFKSMWVAYEKSIKNALITTDELKSIAEGLRETDKNKKMSVVSSMSSEDAKVYRTLKEAGLKPTAAVAAVAIEDELEGAAEPAEILAENDAPAVEFDLDGADAAMAYIDDDYEGENPDMLEDD